MSPAKIAEWRAAFAAAAYHSHVALRRYRLNPDTGRIEERGPAPPATELDALLRAVAVAPHERTGWLALADALREHGREGEADLIGAGGPVAVDPADGGRVLPAQVLLLHTPDLGGSGRGSYVAYEWYPDPRALTDEIDRLMRAQDPGLGPGGFSDTEWTLAAVAVPSGPGEPYEVLVPRAGGAPGDVVPVRLHVRGRVEITPDEVRITAPDDPGCVFGWSPDELEDLLPQTRLYGAIHQTYG